MIKDLYPLAVYGRAVDVRAMIGDGGSGVNGEGGSQNGRRGGKQK
jgi:hypothetical protein